MEWACQNQPAPVQPFYIKPENIFTHNPPSSYSNITAAPAPPSSHGLSQNVKIALVISLPIGAFLVLSLLFVWLFVNRHRNPPKNRRSYYDEKHISKSSAGWEGPSRKGFDQTRNGTASPRPVPYPLPLNPQKVSMPGPLRPQKSNPSIPFSKVFGSPIYDQPMPLPLKPQKSNQSIPFLQPTRYSPPHPNAEPRKDASFLPESKRPPGPPSGLVSWERIAIQNARIRASQAPSPSPVSPLTKVQVVQIPRSLGHRQASIPFRHKSPFRQDSPFQHDLPFRQDSLIPLSRKDSQPILRRPSSSTLGTTHLLSQKARPPQRHRSNRRRKRSSGRLSVEPQPPRRQGTPGQGEMLREDAPAVPIPYDDPTESPMMPLSPIRPLSPILRPDALRSTDTLRPNPLRPNILRPEMRRPNTLWSDTTQRSGTIKSDTTTTPRSTINPETTPRPDATAAQRSGTLKSVSTYRSAVEDDFRTDTPNPNDGILSRRSGTSNGVMRSGSGKSRGSRKEVRWSKDVDYEDGWGRASASAKSAYSGWAG